MACLQPINVLQKIYVGIMLNLQKCLIKPMCSRSKRYSFENLYKEAMILDIRQLDVLQLLKSARRNEWILMPDHCYATRGRTNKNVNYPQTFKILYLQTKCDIQCIKWYYMLPVNLRKHYSVYLLGGKVELLKIIDICFFIVML